MVQGLSEAAAKRIVEARRERSLESTAGMAHQAQLNRHDLKCLAAAGALATLAGHRRQAYWAIAAVETRPHILSRAPVGETRAVFAPPTEGEDLVADYASVGLTLGRHPLALLRPRLAHLRYSTAAELRFRPGGQRARAAGIVTGRQRPDTASGAVFVTLEDETGCVNVIVCRDLTERQRRELLGARLMGVEGVLERQGEVVHLIAWRLLDHSALLGELKTRSRDFH